MKSILKKITNIEKIKNVFKDSIPPELLFKIRKEYKISKDTEVLFLWKLGRESLIITMDFIASSWVDGQDIYQFNWEDIGTVEYNADSYAFEFFLRDDIDSCYKLGRRRFGFIASDATDDLVLEEIEYYLDNIAENYFIYKAEYQLNALGDIPEEEDKREEIANQIFEICDYCRKHTQTEYLIIHTALFQAFAVKKEYKKAKEEIDFILDNNLAEDSEELCQLYEFKADLCDELEDVFGALESYTKALNLCQDSVQSLEYRDRIEYLAKILNEKFLEIPYRERKLILIDNEFKSVFPDTFIVLDKNNLPQNLKFPNNDPKIRELYIAHPYIKESYLPFSSYEANLSSDKFDEFFYFVQCLGAKKITYRIIKGNNTNQTRNSNLNIDLSASLGKGLVKNTGSGVFERDKEQKQQEDILDSRAKTQKFKPVKAPYIPNDLLWYPHEQTWHRLYQQRINGNILNHYEIISSKSALSISNNEKNNLKLAFKNYFVDAGLNINHSIEETFEQNESLEWEISIEFETIANLTEKSTTISEVSSDFEREYLEEVKFMLEDDGVIDDKERSILERFRVKKGISKERAIDIENTLTSLDDLNEIEKEYLDEYQELLNDGEITEKERRILNRMAIRYNISEQRVIELENR